MEAQRNTLPQLPKIPSFYKFSNRDKEDNLDWRTRSWLGIADNPPISTAFNALLGINCSRIVFFIDGNAEAREAQSHGCMHASRGCKMFLCFFCCVRFSSC